MIKDVLMYISNQDISHIMNNIVPKFKYALIEIAASKD